MNRFLCVLATLLVFFNASVYARPGSGPSHRTTTDIRLMWKDYRCSKPSMKTLMVNEMDPKTTALVMVHNKAEKAFRALHGVMSVYGYAARVPLETTGGYSCSKGPSGKFTLHAYGIAADYDWTKNKYQDDNGKLETNMNNEMITAIEAIQTTEGEQVFRWGGNFKGHRSPMHFEVIVSPRALDKGISEVNMSLRGFGFFKKLAGAARGLLGGASGSPGGSLLQRGIGALSNLGGNAGRVGNILSAVTSPGSLTDKLAGVASQFGARGAAIGNAVSALTGSGSAMDKIGAIANSVGSLTGNNRISSIANFVGNAAQDGGVPSLDSVRDLIGGLRGNNQAAAPGNNQAPAPSQFPPAQMPEPQMPAPQMPAPAVIQPSANPHPPVFVPQPQVPFRPPTTVGSAPPHPTRTPSPAVIRPVVRPTTGRTPVKVRSPAVTPARGGNLARLQKFCKTFSCPSGTSYKIGMDPANHSCGLRCNTVKCCSNNQVCGAIRCGAGTQHRNKLAQCTSASCSQNECCIAIAATDCGAYKCPAGNHLLANAKTIDCPSGTCQSSKCCGKSASCTPAVCAASKTGHTAPKLNPSPFCKGAACADTECCDKVASTAKPAVGKCSAVQCGARTPLTAPAACKIAQCTLDECCAKPSATTVAPGAATAGSNGKPIGKHPNLQIPAPKFDPASFAGAEGSIPEKNGPVENTEVNRMLQVDAKASAASTTNKGKKGTAAATADDPDEFEPEEDVKPGGKKKEDDSTAKILMIVGIVIGGICVLIVIGFLVVVAQRKGQNAMGGMQQNYYRQQASPMQPATGHGSAGGQRMPQEQFQAGLPASLKNYDRNPASISIAMQGGVDNEDFYRQGRLYSDVDDGFSTGAANRGV